MADSSSTRHGYDQVAAQYSKRRDQMSSVPYLEMLNEKLRPNSVVLDLGCGTGLPVDRWLIDHGHRVIGLDISPEMLALARANVPEACYELRDMATLSTDEYSVDAAVCFFAMFHIDRSLHQQFLRCIHSYLAPNGLLLITTGRNDWEGEKEFLGVPLVWSHFDQETNGVLIEKAEFTVLLEDQHEGNSDEADDWHPIFFAQSPYFSPKESNISQQSK